MILFYKYIFGTPCGCVALSAAKRTLCPILQFLVVACWTAFHTLWCCSLVCWRPGGQGRPWAEGRPPTPGRLHSARGKRSDNNGPDDLLHPYTLPYTIHKFLWKRVDGKFTFWSNFFVFFACLIYGFDFQINRRARQQVNISPGESDDSEFKIVSAIFWDLTKYGMVGCQSHIGSLTSKSNPTLQNVTLFKFQQYIQISPFNEKKDHQSVLCNILPFMIRKSPVLIIISLI